MAYVSDQKPHSTSWGQSAFKSVANAFAAVTKFLGAVAEQNANFIEMKRLHAMSDVELAKEGLTRDDIARRVFGSRYYL